MLSNQLIQLLIAVVALAGVLGAIGKLAVDALSKALDKSLTANNDVNQIMVTQQEKIANMLDNHLTTLYKGQNELLQRSAVIQSVVDRLDRKSD